MKVLIIAHCGHRRWIDSPVPMNGEQRNLEKNKPCPECLTFAGFVRAAHVMNVIYPEWRKGQALFNTLYEIRPDLANEVQGTYFDPFRVDDRIGPFLTFVMVRW